VLNLLEYACRGLLTGAVYGVLALPLSLAFLTTTTIDFAVGAYALVAAAVAAQAGGTFGLVAGLASAMTCSAVLVLVLMLLKRRRADYRVSFILASLGWIAVLSSLVFWTKGATALLSGAMGGVVQMGPLILPLAALMNLAVGVGLVAMLQVVLFRTHVGKVMRATAINPRAASLAGIRVPTVEAATILAGGLLGGIAGLLLYFSSGLDYNSPLTLSFAGFGAAVVFGMERPLRCFIGGLVLGVVEALSAGYASGALATMIPMTFVLVVLSLSHAGSARFSGDRP
jgi:branched-chain amino acid transport system permease protein